MVAGIQGIIVNRKYKMKIYFLHVFVFAILVFACSTSTDFNATLNFNDINITCYKSGGWINPYKLRIENTGLVNVYAGSYSSTTATDSNSSYLSGDEKNKICRLFATFNQFKRHYEPDHYLTDQNYFTIILRNKTSIDTTSIYDPSNCNLPEDLIQIINFMEHKLDELLIDHVSKE